MKKNSEVKEISIVSSWPLQFSQALPYILELDRRGVKLHFFVSKHIKQLFPEVVAIGEEVVDLDLFIKNSRIAYLTHSLLKKISLKTFRLLFARLGVTRHPEAFVNLILSKVCRVFFRNPFPTSKVFHVTKARVPYLFCARGLKIYTLVGSWDHPRKIDAAGHQSDCVFVWNNELAEDWKKSQGDKKVVLCFPMPFRYLIGDNPTHIRRLNVSKPLTVMYPMTSASENINGWFEEECRLVEALAIACKRAYISLFVKPKPYEGKGALSFLANFDNVEIGAFNDSYRKEDLVLTEDYNEIRLTELSKCDIAINIGTTFVLEAALYGLPILQLKINGRRIFPMLSKLQRMQHIDKYLLARKDYVFEIDEGSELEDQFFLILTNIDVLNNKSSNFSKSLANWIYPDGTFESRMNDVVSTMLE